MSVTLKTKRAYNFSAGPAVLPEIVLEEVQQNLLALPGVGSSVLEISHRSKDFVAIYEDAYARIKRLLAVPDTHEILFLQGGARLQNTMIPMNLIESPNQTADYAITGAWGKKSAAEVARFGKLNIAFDGSVENFTRTPSTDELSLTADAAYFHFTSNETIHGVQFRETPQVDVPLVADQSSDFMSRVVDVSKFGLIYACAQKNIGVAGVTVVIIRKDLLDRAGGRLPGYLEYRSHAAAGSMFNTPPTFAVYVTGLVAKWLEETVGGIAQIEKLNREKASMLYAVLDEFPELYLAHARPECRSMMNVVFRLPTEELESEFLSGATARHLTSLKGHRSVGGIRASIYNAMPLEGVSMLANYMKEFGISHG